MVLFIIDKLDSGTRAFEGSERWLEIAMRAGSADNTDRAGYTLLSPRRKITPALHTLRSADIHSGAFPDEHIADDISISAAGNDPGYNTRQKSSNWPVFEYDFLYRRISHE